MDGPDAVFRINWGWTFHVHPVGDKLAVLITYDGGGRQEAVALRVSEGDLGVPAVLPTPPPGGIRARQGIKIGCLLGVGFCWCPLNGYEWQIFHEMCPQLRSATREILTNREVIAVDQDSLGLQGTRVFAEGAVEVWSKQLHGGARAVGVFNRGSQQASVSFTWDQLGGQAKPAILRDLWRHQDIAPAEDGFGGSVPAHGVTLLLVSGATVTYSGVMGCVSNRGAAFVARSICARAARPMASVLVSSGKRSLPG